MVLLAVDSKLRLEMGTEGMLSRILKPLRESYDFILIDTYSSLGALTINALAAADEVIITVNSQLLAMMGLQDFLKIVGKITSRINNRLSVAGILLTMYDARTNLCKVISERAALLAERYDKVFYQRKRDEIVAELKDLEIPKEPEAEKGGHDVYHSKNRDNLGE